MSDLHGEIGHAVNFCLYWLWDPSQSEIGNGSKLFKMENLGNGQTFYGKILGQET